MAQLLVGIPKLCFVPSLGCDAQLFPKLPHLPVQGISLVSGSEGLQWYYRCILVRSQTALCVLCG